MPFSPWTPERIERLRELWAMGLSASQVAARMNAEAREQLFTRNSIVGKVSRLNIPMRNADMGKRRTSETPRRPGADSTMIFDQTWRWKRMLDADKHVDVVDETDPPPEERVPLIELEETTCRFPIGDPRTAEFGFCPHAKVPGLPYCKTHAKRVYNVKEDGEIAKILETEDA
jgi:GcrA cell cycle regulator